jgi:succinyl-diaminopimelate desuccinylase
VLDLGVDAGTLTAALVDIESVSGDEDRLAGLVDAALRGCAGLHVERIGNAVLARTDRGAAERIVLAGHLDTVPIAGNVPARVEDGLLYGCGTVDMKSGVAVMLRLAHLVATRALDPRFDLTWLFYDCEEVEAARNGLGRLLRAGHEAWFRGDLAILLEPTDGVIEGGCQGTLRVVVTTHGVRAHSARSWLGENAIHAAAPILATLAAYQARTVDVDGLTYREGLVAVGIDGGVAGNVVPDECRVSINFRFAPDRSAAEAEAHVRSLFGGYDVTVVDCASGARPGLDRPIAAAVVAATGAPARAKLGWTDVARFGELGIPAVNYGPGDPNLAHKAEERVGLARIDDCERALVRFLGSAPLGTAR